MTLPISERELRRLRDEYAALLRAHTRAIWALKLPEQVDYPEAERSETGKHAQAVLAWVNGRIGDTGDQHGS